MSSNLVVTDIKQVTIRFSGDSGDGMQLSGTLFSTLSAIFGNEIATFPQNTYELLKKHKKVIVAEQNNGQFASYLKGKFQDLDNIHKYNRIEGQPFKVSALMDEFIKIAGEK